ncbi:3100_t:CDS:1, partial [Gigaspora margarita]
MSNINNSEFIKIEPNHILKSPADLLKIEPNNTNLSNNHRITVDQYYSIELSSQNDETFLSYRNSTN